MTHDVLSQFFSTLIHLLIFFLLIFSCPVTPTQYIENKRKEKKGETSIRAVGKKSQFLTGHWREAGTPPCGDLLAGPLKCPRCMSAGFPQNNQRVQWWKLPCLLWPSFRSPPPPSLHSAFGYRSYFCLTWEGTTQEYGHQVLGYRDLRGPNWRLAMMLLLTMKNNNNNFNMMV